MFLQVDCNDNSAVFAHCFPSQLLPLFLDGLPFCEFLPIHSTSSNRLNNVFFEGDKTFQINMLVIL